LLLDEPTASIDPRGKFCFYEFLGKLRGQISLIVVSHDLFMVSPFFNSIAVVNKGLARLREAELSPENLTALFGRHLHDCPVADLQHLGRNPHPDGCTHPNCAEKTPEAVSRRSPLLTAPKQDR
jgi:ABC-type Mn2+/Zn2+ transport system ATPase subunit